MKENIQALASKYFRYPRHAKALLQHAGPRKLANVLLVESERLRGRTYLRGKPYYYFVDPCNVCNLRCPLCPTATGDLTRPRGMLKLAEYKAILAKIAPYAVEISLHNWGEPFLNKDIFAIISETRKLGIATNLSSNLSVEQDDLAEKIIASGIEYLIVSLDGVTQDVYGEYRVRGDVDLVFHNLRALVAAKKERGSKTPVVEWQFVVFRHNEHQMDLARQRAAEIGVDRLYFRSPGLAFERMSDEELAAKWMPGNPSFWDLHPHRLNTRGYLWSERCFYLYRSMAINPGGGVSPCCLVYHEQHDFGNLLRQELADIWNNSQYRAARSLFTRHPTRQCNTICAGCHLFRRSTPVAIDPRVEHA